MVEHAHTSVQLSHPPNVTSLNFRVHLVVNPLSCHKNFVPQPPSLYSDDVVLCYSILDSTLVVNEDQAIDRVGVAQPTRTGIHENYEWEPENQPVVNDDSLSFVPPPLFLDIFGDSTIPDFTCVSPSMDAPIVDHS